MNGNALRAEVQDGWRGCAVDDTVKGAECSDSSAVGEGLQVLAPWTHEAHSAALHSV